MENYEKAVKIYAEILVDVSGYKVEEVKNNNYQLVRESDTDTLFQNILQIISE